MSSISAELTVFLKDADLVASTAFLTLTGKMGYGETLLGLKRFDYFAFRLDRAEEEDPQQVVDQFIRVLSSQSTFFNRNKHFYHLSCSWDGSGTTNGTGLELAERKLGAEVSNSLIKKQDRKLSVQSGSNGVTFRDDSVFLGKLLVQERDQGRKRMLSHKLRDELGGRAVECTDCGVQWWLALRSNERGGAQRLLEEIAVTVKRDRGLLVNPHYQEYSVLAVAKLDVNDV